MLEKVAYWRCRSSRKALTGRETQILKLIVQGKSTKEIARDLDCSPRTVEVHRYSIMFKLDARNIAHLVAIAVSTGLVPLELPNWWLDQKIEEQEIAADLGTGNDQ